MVKLFCSALTSYRFMTISSVVETVQVADPHLEVIVTCGLFTYLSLFVRYWGHIVKVQIWVRPSGKESQYCFV